MSFSSNANSSAQTDLVNMLQREVGSCMAPHTGCGQVCYCTWSGFILVTCSSVCIMQEWKSGMKWVTQDAGGSGDRLKCVHNKSESAFTQSCGHLESCLVTEHSMI